MCVCVCILLPLRSMLTFLVFQDGQAQERHVHLVLLLPIAACPLGNDKETGKAKSYSCEWMLRDSTTMNEDDEVVVKLAAPQSQRENGTVRPKTEKRKIDVTDE